MKIEIEEINDVLCHRATEDDKWVPFTRKELEDIVYDCRLVYGHLQLGMETMADYFEAK